MHFTSLIIPVSKSTSHTDALHQSLQQLEYTQTLKSTSPNLSIFNSQEESPKIEQVRAMISEASLKAYENKIRVLALLRADEASIPAQNALLKLVEEPPVDTQVILTVSNPDNLLLTIQSRCNIIETKELKNLETKNKFLSPSVSQLPINYSQAIELASQYKDRESALTLVEQLIIDLHTKNSQSPSPSVSQSLRVLQDTYNYLQMNVNVKLTLEWGLFQLIN